MQRVEDYCYYCYWPFVVESPNQEPFQREHVRNSSSSCDEPRMYMLPVAAARLAAAVRNRANNHPPHTIPPIAAFANCGYSHPGWHLGRVAAHYYYSVDVSFWNYHCNLVCCHFHFHCLVLPRLRLAVIQPLPLLLQVFSSSFSMTILLSIDFI